MLPPFKHFGEEGEPMPVVGEELSVQALYLQYWSYSHCFQGTMPDERCIYNLDHQGAEN